MGDLVRSRYNKGRNLLFAAASAQALAIAGPAFAQDETERASGNDIIVTAQFREERLQDTPIAITAISGEDLSNKALTTIADVATTAPNVNIQSSQGSYGGPTIYIRGVGQYDSSFAYEQGVGLYVDDVYHGVLIGSLFDLLDLDRVEILRGPQGTLAGKNSIGGAVKLFSKAPQGDGSGYITATYGSLNRMEIRGAYDIGLTDNLAMRISGFSKRRDGYVDILDFNCDRPGEVLPTDPWVTQVTGTDDCKIGSLGGISAWGLRGALRFTPSDNLEINVYGTITRDSSEPPAIEQVVNPDPRFSNPRNYVYYETYTTNIGWNDKPENINNFESITGKIDWSVSDNFSVTSITAYENVYSSYVAADGTPAGINVVRNITPYHQFTQELRLNGQVGDGLLDFTVGGFYFDSLGYVGARIYDAPILNWIQDDPVSTESKSVFGHVVLHPTENMSITGGVRYTDDTKSYKFVRLNSETGEPLAGGPDDPLNVGVLNTAPPATYAGDSFDYRIGIDYRFSDQFMAYANMSTGYKGGGVNPRPFTALQAVSFDPERVTAYELGFKSDLFDNRFRLNGAVFLNKYKDIILIDTNGYADFFLSAVPINGGDADVKGAELETTIEPTDGLTFQGSVSYLDFQYTNILPDAIAGGVTLGSSPPYTPQWRWSAEVAYEIPFENGATLTPRFFADYTGSYNTLPENRPTNFIPSRTMLNANITYVSPSSDWEVVAGVTNLTDKHYYFSSYDNTVTKVAKGVGRPREFYVTVRKNF